LSGDLAAPGRHREAPLDQLSVHPVARPVGSDGEIPACVRQEFNHIEGEARLANVGRRPDHAQLVMPCRLRRAMEPLGARARPGGTNRGTLAQIG
jgi:hypothetical protein